MKEFGNREKHVLCCTNFLPSFVLDMTFFLRSKSSNLNKPVSILRLDLLTCGLPILSFPKPLGHRNQTLKGNTSFELCSCSRPPTVPAMALNECVSLFLQCSKLLFSSTTQCSMADITRMLLKSLSSFINPQRLGGN